MKQFQFSKIKEFREAASMTQGQLGEKVGVVKQQISAWENSSDEKSLTTIHLAKIANALQKATDDFFVEVSQ